MSLRAAFAGFRHGHIYGLYEGMRSAEDVNIVAACEEDPVTREEIKAGGRAQITHDNLESMLDGIDCDIVAIGDIYTKRGAIAIRALEHGRHVISDKPLCTSLAEIKKIEELARTKNLCVGLQLDLRSNKLLATLRRLVQDGVLGEIINISFSGQHPLNLGSRPAWYFQPGSHGGTINDIAIHGIDAISWLTGRSVEEALAARAWNAKTPQFPHFQDCAQMMLRLDNGGGALGDVSYLAPDGCGYAMPQYWRFICHGVNGAAETNKVDETISIATHKDKAVRVLPADTEVSRGYLQDFLDEVRGQPNPEGLSTRQVLYASETTLKIQAVADRASC